ncbi:hypothetical protein UACE39S_04230 [Ureibacillus acetophenoni]
MNRIVKFFNITSLKGRLHFWFLSFLSIIVLAAAIPFVLIQQHQQRENAKYDFEKAMDVQQLVMVRRKKVLC